MNKPIRTSPSNASVRHPLSGISLTWRVSALLLVFILLLGFSPVPASAVSDPAEDYYPYEIGLIRIQFHDDCRYERILKDEAGNYYFSAGSIEQLTGYHLDTETDDVQWLLQKYPSEITTSYHKKIKIDYEYKTAHLKQYSIDLPGLPVYDGQVWLPIAEIMPMLDTVLYVEDNTLYMDQPKASLIDALNDLPILSLYFDAAQEFSGQSWADMIQVGIAYWYETFKGIKISNLTPQGSKEAYRAVFIEYLTDRDVYEKALDYDKWKDDLENLQTFSNELDKSYGLAVSSLKVILHFAETADSISLYGSDDYLTGVFYEMIPEDIFEGMKEFGDVLKCAATAADYAINMALMVKDNYSMLKAVYPEVVSESPAFSRSSEESDGVLSSVSDALHNLYHVKTKLSAASSVYDAYSSEDVGTFTFHYVMDLLEDLSVDTFNETVLQKALGLDLIAFPAAQLTGAVMDTWMKDLGVEAPEDMARLNHHIIVENDALEAYTYYVSQIGASYNWETLEQTRLSAIMTLLSAKRCFEIIRDNNRLNDEVVSYCDNRIAQIVPYLARLYLAGEGVLTDGVDFFTQETAALRDSLKDLVIVPEDPVLAIYGKWFRENMPEDRINNDYIYLADVTRDGVLEMIVTHYGDEGLSEPIRLDEYEFNQGDYDFTLSNLYNEGVFMQIYTIRDGAVKLIYERAASFSHLGWTFLLLCRYDQGYAILDVLNSTYQGYNTLQYTVYIPANYETRDLTPGNYYENGDREILASDYCEDGVMTDAYQQDLANLLDGSTIILNTQYENTLPAGTTRYASWFAYLEIFEEPENEGNPFDNSDGGDDSPGFDLTRAYAAEALTEGLWITNLDYDETLWLTFEGTADDLTMRYGVTEWNTDYTCSVRFERSGEQFVIQDGQAISHSMPEFYQTGYSIVYDDGEKSLRIDLSFGDSLIFYDIN